MENRSHALVAGLFTLLLTAALIATGLWFRGDTVRRTGYQVASRHEVAGLTAQATVKLHGVNVGKVKSVRFDPSEPALVLIDIDVESGAPVTEGTYATLGYQGVTGIAFIQLHDEGKRPKPLPPGGRIEMRASLLQRFTESGQDVLDGATEAAKRLADLLSPENQAQLRRTLSGLESAASRFVTLADGTEQDVQRTLRSAERAFASVAQLSEDVRRSGVPMLERIDRLALRLDDRVERFAAAADSAAKLGEAGAAVGQSLNASTLPRVDAVADDLSRTARSIEALAARLDAATVSLNRAMDHLADNPEQLLYGPPMPAPGPGEPGFAPPQRSAP